LAGNRTVGVEDLLSPVSKTEGKLRKGFHAVALQGDGDASTVAYTLNFEDGREIGSNAVDL
jgi:hypothetical protein